MRPFWKEISGVIWKCTVEKSQTNAINATFHPFRQGHIWKRSGEKSYKCNQAMWLCLLWSELFQSTFENARWKKYKYKYKCNFASIQAGHLWKHLKTHSGEKSYKCKNVTRHLLWQAIWGHIWQRTVEKSQTNATNVTMPALIQSLSIDIWKRRVNKQIYVTNATMLSFKQAIWGSIWKLSISKYKCIAIDFHFHSFKILGQIQQIRDVLLSPPPQFGHMA